MDCASTLDIEDVDGQYNSCEEEGAEDTVAWGRLLPVGKGFTGLGAYTYNGKQRETVFSMAASCRSDKG